MPRPADNLTGTEYARSFAAMAGLAAALVGGVAWIAGWRHGHSLATLGLLGAFVFEHDWRVYLRRGWAVGYVLRARQSVAKSELEKAEAYLAKAERIFRKIAAHRRAQVWDLAATLDQRRMLLVELGRYDDALAVAQEAVATWREVVADDAARRPHLAQALTGAAVLLGRLNREAEALPLTEEAIAITRQLVGLYESRLAVNLSNVVISLSDIEEWERALPAAVEAWEIRRRLAVANPELRDDAIDDADRLRGVLYRLNRPDETVSLAESLVEHEHALTADNPDRLPSYAEAVRKLGTSLGDVGRVPEAKARWYEAIELLRRFSEDNPDDRPSYATICERVSHSLGMLRADEETLTVIRAGLAVRRALAGEDGRHYQELVRALASAAVRMEHAEQPELARQFAAEGLALYHAKPEISWPPQIVEVLQEHAGKQPPADP